MVEDPIFNKHKFGDFFQNWEKSHLNSIGNVAEISAPKNTGKKITDYLSTRMPF